MSKLPQFPVEGGCICGAVRYRVSAPPMGVYNCHCKDCQRQSGADYSASMLVRRQDFAVVAGNPLVFDKRADSGRIVRQYACPVCHTRLYNEPLASPDVVVIKPGTLDDRSWAVPVGAIWTDSKLPWSEIDPAEPSFPGQPGSREPLFAAWRERVGIA
ncbi:MAG TPA: GFA family protein [Devosia sp.]|nr:GFA family protein [Devosia sp.]